MKTLLLLRHGKSDWSTEIIADHDRPLAPRGVKAARRVGRFLTGAGLVPDAVVSSTAVRARTTAELAAESGGWACPIETTRRIYEGGAREVLEEIRGRGGEAGTLLVAGHEPTFSELASRLVGGGELRMVTAAVAVIELAAESWRELDDDRGELVCFVPPRYLKKLGV